MVIKNLDTSISTSKIVPTNHPDKMIVLEKIGHLKQQPLYSVAKTRNKNQHLETIYLRRVRIELILVQMPSSIDKSQMIQDINHLETNFHHIGNKTELNKINQIKV